MPDSYTPLGLTKPEVGASRDSWGTKWNANADLLDSKINLALANAATAQGGADAKLPLAGGTMTGALAAPRLNLDGQYYAAVAAGNTPVLNWDGGDNLAYNRAADTLVAHIANAARFTLSASDAVFNVPVTLNVGGTLAQHATRKDYVDAVAAQRLPLSGGVLSGDLTTYRAAAPNTGVVFLGNSGQRYLFFDGARYVMPGSDLVLNGGTVYTTANLDLSPFARTAGATFTGALRSAAQVVSQGAGSNPAVAVWDQSQGAAVGLMLGGGNVAYIANTDGNGNYAGSWRAYFAANGDLVAGGNVVANSDRRLKTGLRPVEGALSKLAGVGGYSYEKLSEPGARHLGVVAQEVEAAFPEAVAANPDGHLAVSYSGLVGVLVAAVNELSAKVAALEAKAGG